MCVCSVSMNAWELVAGSYFISVRCGPQPVQFTVVTELFTGELASGDTVTGLVCSGTAMQTLRIVILGFGTW
jgi:hypothetical protein